MSSQSAACQSYYLQVAALCKFLAAPDTAAVFFSASRLHAMKKKTGLFFFFTFLAEKASLPARQVKLNPLVTSDDPPFVQQP